MFASPHVISIALDHSLREARRGVRLGHGGPFGAIIVKGNRMVASGHNTVIRDSDPTAHAEINVIRRAAKKLGLSGLRGVTLVTSSEPCPLCLAAAYWAGIKEIRYVLPKPVADKYGFRDGLFYAELAKKREARRIKMTQARELVAAGEAVFAEWKKRGGKLY